MKTESAISEEEKRLERNRKNRERRSKNIEKYKQYKRNSLSKPENRKKMLDYARKYNASYKEIKNARRRERYANDPNYNIEHRYRTRLQKLLKLSGINKSRRTLDYLGCTSEEFRRYIESKFNDGMNWDNKGEWHIDHIKPCCSFDLTKEDQLNECFHYTNLRPLWGIDNLYKKQNDILCKRKF